MRSDPLASVLINNYNYGRYLGEAIESVLAQTYSHLEIIVVDDGSTDNSREVLEAYAGRVVAVMKENGGQASAFNAGFAASHGDIIFFLDSDDLFLPDKVQTIVEIYAKHPEAGWCFDMVHEYEDRTGTRYPPPRQCTLGLWDARPIIAEGETPFIPTATSGLSFRRSTLALMLPMPDNIRITSDGYLKLVALGLVEGWMASEELSLQRIHPNNAYTHRKVGRKHIKGLTGILTGICLYERFPAFRRLGATLFSRGLGLCWIAGGAAADYKPVAKSFLRAVPMSTRLGILIRAASVSARDLVTGK